MDFIEKWRECSLCIICPQKCLFWTYTPCYTGSLTPPVSPNQIFFQGLCWFQGYFSNKENIMEAEHDEEVVAFWWFLEALSINIHKSTLIKHHTKTPKFRCLFSPKKSLFTLGPPGYHDGMDASWETWPFSQLNWPIGSMVQMGNPTCLGLKTCMFHGFWA